MNLLNFILPGHLKSVSFLSLLSFLPPPGIVSIWRKVLSNRELLQPSLFCFRMALSFLCLHTVIPYPRCDTVSGSPLLCF